MVRNLDQPLRVEVIARLLREGRQEADHGSRDQTISFEVRNILRGHILTDHPLLLLTS